MQAAGRPKTSADVNHCLYLHIFPDTTLLCPLAWRQGTSIQNAHWVSRCCTHQRLDAATMSCACECSTRLLQQHPKTRERERERGQQRAQARSEACWRARDEIPVVLGSGQRPSFYRLYSSVAVLSCRWLCRDDLVVGISSMRFLQRRATTEGIQPSKPKRWCAS